MTCKLLLSQKAHSLPANIIFWVFFIIWVSIWLSLFYIIHFLHTVLCIWLMIFAFAVYTWKEWHTVVCDNLSCISLNCTNVYFSTTIIFDRDWSKTIDLCQHLRNVINTRFTCSFVAYELISLHSRFSQLLCFSCSISTIYYCVCFFIWLAIVFIMPYHCRS